MTGHLQSAVAPQLEINQNLGAVAKGVEAMLTPVKTSVDEQEATDPASAAHQDSSPAPVTTTAHSFAATAITTHLPACNPPNLFTSTPHSKLTARRFLDQCQLVFDYTDASADYVQGSQMTDEYKIMYAASFMRANAGDWVHRWRESTKAEARTWEQFKKAVARRYKSKVAPQSKDRHVDSDWRLRFTALHINIDCEGKAN
jgi:hypothetical protein